MVQHRQARQDAQHTETKLFSMFLFEKIRVNPRYPWSEIHDKFTIIHVKVLVIIIVIII